MKDTIDLVKEPISDTTESVRRVLEIVDDLARRGDIAGLWALSDEVWDVYLVRAAASRVPLLDLYLYVGLVAEADGEMDDVLRRYRDTMLSGSAA